MSGCDVGGDDSVKVTSFVDNLEPGTVCNRREGFNGWEQSVVDETPDGASFSVGVKMPVDSAAFVRSLQVAAEEAQKNAGTPGYVVRFELPIERKNNDQLQIRWKSVDKPTKRRPSSLKRAVSAAGKGKSKASAKANGRSASAKRSVRRSVKKKRR